MNLSVGSGPAYYPAPVSEYYDGQNAYYVPNNYVAPVVYTGGYYSGYNRGYYGRGYDRGRHYYRPAARGGFAHAGRGHR